MRTLNRVLRIAVAVAVGGMALRAVGCGSIAQYIANINPCGTILNCDPVEYSFIRSGYEGPGANPGVDPACTFPPFCENDPFVSSQATQQ